MPDNTLKEAIKEAYASAPTDVVILHTLELYHPNFKDENGNAFPVRLVRDFQNFEAKLEPSAARNSNSEEPVTFYATTFEMELPKTDKNPLPEIKISIDNVSGLLTPQLDLAVQGKEEIEIIYRPYLNNDTEGPQMDPPLKFILSEVSVNNYRVTGTARILDIGLDEFPSDTFTTKRFPSLKY